MAKISEKIFKALSKRISLILVLFAFYFVVFEGQESAMWLVYFGLFLTLYEISYEVSAKGGK